MWIKFWILKIHLTTGERCNKTVAERGRETNLNERGCQWRSLTTATKCFVSNHNRVTQKVGFQLKLLHFSRDNTLNHDFVKAIEYHKSFFSLDLQVLEPECLRFLQQTLAWVVGVHWRGKSHSKPWNWAPCLEGHSSHSHHSVEAVTFAAWQSFQCTKIVNFSR